MSAQTPFPDFRERVRAVNAAALPGALARLRWSRAELERHQRKRLRGLLARAAQRSSFYAQRLRGVDAEGFELADLARLPTTSKAELMERLDEVFTDPRLSRANVEEALAETRHEPQEEAMKLEMHQQIDRAIGTLPEAQRTAVILYSYESMPYEDIAKVLKTSVSSVKSLLFRARTTLREKLASYMAE